MSKRYLIIGGGIIGSSIALELTRRKLGEVIVFEKENEIGIHASGRNSGVIHSGINQKPGNLKADMCLRGSEMLREFCKDYTIPYEECGTLVIARNKTEEKSLETLLDMGKKIGVPGLKIIEKDELVEREPVVFGTKALYSPTGSIVDSKKLVDSISLLARESGAKYFFGEKVVEIINEENKVLTDSLIKFNFDHLINCAGIYADKIAHKMKVGLEYGIIPFRGDYLSVDLPINSMVYQTPDLRYPFLGVHFTKSIDGKVLTGPTATLSWKGRESYEGDLMLPEFLEMISSRNFGRLITNGEFIKLAFDNTRISLFRKSFVNEANSLLKPDYHITKDDVKPYRSGIRAQIVDRKGKMVDDFIVEKGRNSTHVLNTVSPGMTSSLAFAQYVVKNYIL